MTKTTLYNGSRWFVITRIQCTVCFHSCALAEGQVGICRARKNIDGKIISLSYGEITAIQLDPVAKKPFSNYYPNKNILSVGSLGCNLRCPFCQNSHIVFNDIKNIHTKHITPEELAIRAEELVPNNNIGVAYTYNEPLVGYEFVLDCSKEIHKRGLKNVVVTNGSVTTRTLEKVLPYIDAFNIDLKGFTKAYYKWLGGDLDTVLEFIKTAYTNSHIELTTLIVPGKNDSPEEMYEMTKWIASIDKNIPYHISRFFPHYSYTESAPTKIESLFELKQIAKENLNIVSIGNI